MLKLLCELELHWISTVVQFGFIYKLKLIFPNSTTTSNSELFEHTILFIILIAKPQWPDRTISLIFLMSKFFIICVKQLAPVAHFSTTFHYYFLVPLFENFWLHPCMYCVFLKWEV